MNDTDTLVRGKETTDTRNTDAAAEIDRISKKVDRSPALRNSNGVKEAMDELKDAPARNGKTTKEYFAESERILASLNDGIDVFADGDSSPEQIASKSLNLLSSVMYAASAIPGAPVVTAPLGFVIGLVGAVLGALGKDDGSPLLRQFEKIVNDAVDRGVSDQMNDDLEGALRNIYSRLSGMNIELDQGYVEEGDGFTAPTMMDFMAVGSDRIGAAFENLDRNLDVAKHDNWSNAAYTYYLLVRVLLLKGVYLLQGAAWYRMVWEENKEPDDRYGPANSQEVIKRISTEFTPYVMKHAGRYFVNPDLRHAAMTHYIYRLPKAEFRLVATAMGDFLARENRKLEYLEEKPYPDFWPREASQYRTDEGYIRLSTLYDFYEKDRKHVLKQNMRFSYENPTGEASHYSIWSDGGNDDPSPHYRYYLEPEPDHFGRGYERVYIFPVFPSEAEIHAHELPDYGRNTLLMIGYGDKGHDRAWRASSSGDAVHHTQYYKMLNGTHAASKYLWLLLDKEQ